ncbi:hypothetical protein C8J57DRAFT_1391467 [Mycena rebaudengoi]|nr:hypothetical protein C8J57DRAFT_1391467 [Mycena rebaudengoi]
MCRFYVHVAQNGLDFWQYLVLSVFPVSSVPQPLVLPESILLFLRPPQKLIRTFCAHPGLNCFDRKNGPLAQMLVLAEIWIFAAMWNVGSDRFQRPDRYYLLDLNLRL